ncbi:MAG: double-strand break repair protein AddB [Candidatus Tokpelaia sp.]|nr:MAG: double-strand break repair protein AddB [Candidatus Tokpelaia sp.]
MRRLPHIFSVPPGLDFLAESVRALLDNRLIDSADMRDPAQLAKTVIYVPSRWVARALRFAFVEAAVNKAAFLPDIRPLGEMPEDDFSLFAENFDQNSTTAAEAQDKLSRPALIGTVERQALLARLIRPWRENLPGHIRALFGRETVEVPANTADALWLARNLAELMDEMETEGADPGKLQAVAPADLAEWWQVTVEFLHCVFTAWPDILAERHCSTAAARRNYMLRATANRLEQTRRNAGALFQNIAETNRPVLVLGSTGSIPAVADFIKTVAFLPQGAVVLPGLDRHLDETAWAGLDKDEHNPAAFAHPQFALKKLLRRLNVTRDNVTFLGRPTQAQKQREIWISEIFRPANSTEKWQKQRAGPGNNSAFLSTVSLIEAPTMREEALALAVCLRTALEEKNSRATLITSDRVLARRVCGELARFGIQASDSGGTPLAASEPAALIRLLLACIFTPGDAAAILALLKHPLTRLGFARADLRRKVEEFEYFALRGGTGRINLAKADEFMNERLQKLANTEKIAGAFTAERMDEALRLAGQLTAAAAPLQNFAQKKQEVTLEEAVIATIETFENFGRDEQSSLKRLYAEAAGQKLIAFCRSVLASRSGLSFMPLEWPEIFAALIADTTVEMRQNGHPRLFILGLFEARLQNFDTVLIGGLNEGTLPAGPPDSPFLSRLMKAALSLPPPEQKIGFTAHDIAQILAMKKVVLARSLRVDNAPAIASRWLQRLQAVTGEEDFAAIKARGHYYLKLAQKLDYAPEQAFAARPNPKPPPALRPTRFSVTEIEVLRRDPYAVYARRILRLRPLEPLIRDESAAERGTLYHAILAAFSQYYAKADIGAIKPQAEALLLALAREEFAKLQLPPDIAALWWPRFFGLVPNYIAWEAGLSPRQRFAEIRAGDTAINDSGSFLRGRADRIDIMAASGADGEQIAEIIDFKTGSTPSRKQAHILAAPQLALEGALLSRGGFKECGAARAENLFYLRLKADGETVAENIAAQKSKALPAISTPALCEKAWAQLDRLIRHFQNPDNGYLARALPPLGQNASDYDHLARLFEWSSPVREEE